MNEVKHRVTPLLLSALVFALFLGSASAAGSARPDQGVFIEVAGDHEFSGRLIVRPVQYDVWLDSGLSIENALLRVNTARQIMQNQDMIEYVSQTDEYIVRLPSGETENSLSRLLMKTGLFQYAEPDWILFPVGNPDDPMFAGQWHHEPDKMQSADGWDIETGNPTVSVGICDTGILTTHEDLLLHRLEGYNAVDRLWESQGGDIGPVRGHGTQCTGCAAANGNNGIGITGAGWNLSHRMLRVSNGSGGSVNLSVLQHAARVSIESGDRAASVSYTGSDNASNLTTAAYIKSIGGLLFWAAGNDNRNITFGNRDDDDIIVVGATDKIDDKTYFSSYGPFVDLTAPGIYILTTDSDSNNDYATVGGTSFATPLTAGLAALLWSKDPSLTPDQVEDLLKQGCDDLGPSGVDNTFGYGRINFHGSLSLVGGGSPGQIAFDGFESRNFNGGNGDWAGGWDVDGNVIILWDRYQPTTGSGHVLLRQRSSQLERTVDLAGASDVYLRFQARVASWEWLDKAYVKVSSDGINYTTLKTFTTADSDSQYHFYEFLLPGSMTADYRILFESGMSSSSDYLFFDDIEIHGVK